ncbi:MAG: hypothetical protein BGP16_18520 [Sphingobium sp. 66-54]|nr:MAG: hypothetical protein BGP16_18520 [Sphingobium sp. 66-54]
MRVVRVLPQRLQHTHAAIRHHKLEGAIRDCISDQPRLGRAAMLIDIVLQFTQCPHQRCDEPGGKASIFPSIFCVEEPLRPNRITGLYRVL